jgi:hypothetical protein
MKKKTVTVSSKSIFWLQFFVACLFLGRAYQGLFFDFPLRTFFWDQVLLEDVVTSWTGGTWQAYVTNQTFDLDTVIDNIGFILGGLFLVLGIGTIFSHNSPKWALWMLPFGSFLLAILSVLYWKEKFYAYGQLFEYIIQVTAPIVLFYLLRGGVNSKRFQLIIKAIVAVSFCCHGLYAIGYYPVPGPWVQWTMRIFPFFNDAESLIFLQIMGYLDFIAATLLFLRPTWRYAVLYCVFWGTATALARVICNFYIEFPFVSLHDWGYKTILRLVHGGLPLLLFWWSIEHKNAKN